MPEEQEPNAGFTWNCPEPKELPEIRGKLLNWLGDRGAEFYLDCLTIGSQQVRPPGDLGASARQLAVEERRRAAGELYWVSEEMTDLARHAGRQLTRYDLYEHDLPSRRGFMVFAAPLAIANERGVNIEIVAVSWGKSQLPLLSREGPFELSIGDTWDQGAIWFTFYSDPHAFITANTLDESQLAAHQHVGPFLPDNELIWRIGTLEELPEGDNTTAAWGKTTLAAWLIMRQPLATTTTQRAPRPARRRLHKADLPTSDVRLIHVRRPERRPDPQHTQTTRTYAHRWWVTGHWRRVHCGPGRTRIERRWIAPHLAGPDNKPIRGTDRVQIWDR